MPLPKILLPALQLLISINQKLKMYRTSLQNLKKNWPSNTLKATTKKIKGGAMPTNSFNLALSNGRSKKQKKTTQKTKKKKKYHKKQNKRKKKKKTGYTYPHKYQQHT